MPSDRLNEQTDALLERAARAADLEDWPRVIDLTTRILAIAPDHADARALLAMGQVGDPTIGTRSGQGATVADLRCAWCAAVIQPADDRCPRCDRPRSDRSPAPAPSPRTSSVVPAIFGGVVTVSVVAAVLFAGYLYWLSPGFDPTYPVPLDDEWVGTGPVADLEATCPGVGQRICVPALGDPSVADVSIDALTTYFEDAYELPITALPSINLRGMELSPGDLVDKERRQLKADAALELLQTTYPSLWADTQVTLIAVTPHDIFDSRDPDLRYLYSVRATRPGRFVVVSSARMDDQAWGEDPAEAGIHDRTLKLVAREIGALHFGLPFSDDPTSVMTSVFGSRDRIDRADERLSVDDLITLRPDLITGVQVFNRSGRESTGVFEVEPGRWEYCAALDQDLTDRSGGDQRPPALRLSLYTDDGVWLNSDSGAGGIGSLGCTPFSGPGRYELRGYALDGIEWSVAVAPLDAVTPTQPILPAWQADFTTRWVPISNEGGILTFDESEDGSTPWFEPVGRTWDLCWEAYEVPNPGRVPDGNEYLRVTVMLEYEWDTLGEWKYPDPEPGQFGCIQLQTDQPNGRHWVSFIDAADFLGFHYTINGVQLVD